MPIGRGGDADLDSGAAAEATPPDGPQTDGRLGWPLINEPIIGSTTPDPEPEPPQTDGRLGWPLINEPIIPITTPPEEGWVLG